MVTTAKAPVIIIGDHKPGNETLFGTGTADIIYGNKGNDLIYANAGKDTVWGGEHNDSIHAQEDDDLVYGGYGNDALYGNRGNDMLRGEAEDDFVFGGLDQDTVFGGAGNDHVSGGHGKDYIFGGSGNDKLDGVTGFLGQIEEIPGTSPTSLREKELASYDFDSDFLYGGEGNDRIILGPKDVARGELGRDTFVFDIDPFTSGRYEAGNKYHHITIEDFTRGEDQFILGVDNNPGRVAILERADGVSVFDGSDVLIVHGKIDVADISVQIL